MSSREALMNDIWRMRNTSVIAALFELRNTTILFDTLTIDPGLSKNAEVLEMMRKAWFIPTLRRINANIFMFGFSPLAIKKEKYKGQIIEVTVVPEWGTWKVETMEDSHGQTQLEVTSSSDPNVKYIVIRSLLHGGPSHYQPDFIDSECGKLIAMFRELEMKKKIMYHVTKQYLGGKPYVEKHFMKDPVGNPDDDYDRLMNQEILSSLTLEKPPPVECEESETLNVLPTGHFASRFQKDYKIVYDIHREELHFARVASAVLKEPLDHIYNDRGSVGGYNGEALIDKQRSEKTMAISIIISDLIHAAQEIWQILYGTHNSAITIRNGVQMDIPRVIELMRHDMITKDVGRQILYSITGIGNGQMENDQVSRVNPNLI